MLVIIEASTAPSFTRRPGRELRTAFSSLASLAGSGVFQLCHGQTPFVYIL